MSDLLLIHRLLRRLQQRNQFVSRSPQTDLTLAESHFLIEVDCAQARSIGELAELLLIDQGYVSRIAATLEKRGMIRLSQSSSDSRRKEISLTKAGKQKIAEIDRISNERYERFSERLRGEEQQQIIQLFRAIADGYGHPRGKKRSNESEYRVEQRRITRCFGLLGEHVFDSKLSSTTWQVLSEVVLAPVPVTPGDLVLVLATPQNTVSSAINRLLKDKLVLREASTTDRRTTYIKPTAAGQRLVSSIENKACAVLRFALKGISSKKLQASIEALKMFVGESDPTLLPLVDPFTLSQINDEEEIAMARGFLVRSFVEQGCEESLPETILSSRNEVWCLHTAENIWAVAEVEADSQEAKIVLSACAPGVSLAIFHSFQAQILL